MGIVEYLTQVTTTAADYPYSPNTATGDLTFTWDRDPTTATTFKTLYNRYTEAVFTTVEEWINGRMEERERREREEPCGTEPSEEEFLDILKP